MRLATFRVPGGPERAGRVHDDRVVCFAEGVTVPAVLADPDRFRAEGPEHRLDEVELLAPYHPRAVFGVALNYADHTAEVGRERPARPRIFLKGPACTTGPSGPVLRPAGIEQLDYEAELALVVGHDGGVAGYAVADDVSARDVGDNLLTVMKGGPTFCPWGPWVTTADEVADPYALRVRTWVDGEPRQDGSTADMVFRADELLAHIGRTVRLAAGDLVLTGTPAGVGLGMTPPRFLDDGARVRIEIEGLGAIEHTIHPAAHGRGAPA